MIRLRDTYSGDPIPWFPPVSSAKGLASYGILCARPLSGPSIEIPASQCGQSCCFCPHSLEKKPTEALRVGDLPEPPVNSGGPGAAPLGGSDHTRSCATPHPAPGAHRPPAEPHSEGLATSPGISNMLPASRCHRSSEGPWAPRSWCVQLAAQTEPPVPSREAHGPGAAAPSLQWLGAHPGQGSGHKKRRGFCKPWLWKDSRGFLKSTEQDGRLLDSYSRFTVSSTVASGPQG